MDVLVDSLDKQIRGNLLDMTTAIVRLEQALSRGNLEEAHSLHEMLPQLLKYIFGGEGTVGWLELVQHEVELRALYSFLKPGNVFISFLLLHSNEARFSYELTEAEIGTKQGKESVFNSDGRSVLVGQKRSVKVNMFEYYVFFFCRVLRTPHMHKARNTARHRRLDLIWEELVVDLKDLITFGEFHWQLDDHAEVYFMLLSKYLEFFLPLSLTNAQPSLFNSRMFPNVAAALKTSEFCLGMFLELWLVENVQDLYRLDADGEVCKPPRIMTLDLVKAIQIMLQHFSQFDKDSKPSVMSRLNRNPMLDEFGRKFTETLLMQTYRFLRIYIAGWPHDASITGLISLWHTFISVLERPFIGLDVLGRNLLEHLIVSLGHLGSVPINQVDWPAMNSQLDVLLQCTIAILGKLVQNLSWLQIWEEDLPTEAREQIRKYEIEEFQLNAFMTEGEDLAKALALVLERLSGMLEYCEPLHDNKQLIENCAGQLQKCFLVRVDLSKPFMATTAAPVNLDRIGRKRILIEREGGGVRQQSLIAAVWRMILSSPSALYASIFVFVFAYIWFKWL